MTFNFRNLDEKTREIMQDEFNWDREHNNLFLSKRLKINKRDEYLKFLEEAIRGGNGDSLSIKIPRNIFFNEREMSHRNGKPYEKSVPENANEILGNGEFHRFYKRALCNRAINESKNLVIYRARESAQDAQDSSFFIGKKVAPEKMLQFLRVDPENLKTITDDHSAEYRMVRPNSGLSLELI